MPRKVEAVMEDAVVRERWETVSNLRAEERQLERARDLKKAELSEITQSLKKVKAKISALIDNENEPNLFSEVASGQPAAEPAKAEKKSKAKVAPPAGDWKDHKVADLQGIKPKDVKALEGAMLHTLGEVEKYTTKHGTLDGCEGLGKEGASRVERAMQKLLAATAQKPEPEAF